MWYFRWIRSVSWSFFPETVKDSNLAIVHIHYIERCSKSNLYNIIVGDKKSSDLRINWFSIYFAFSCTKNSLLWAGHFKIHTSSIGTKGPQGYVRSSRGPASSFIASCCLASSSRSSCIWNFSCSNSCSRLPVTYKKEKTMCQSLYGSLLHSEFKLPSSILRK